MKISLNYYFDINFNHALLKTLKSPESLSDGLNRLLQSSLPSFHLWCCTEFLWSLAQSNTPTYNNPGDSNLRS